MGTRELFLEQLALYKDKSKRASFSHNRAFKAVVDNDVPQLFYWRVEEEYPFTTIFNENHSLLHIAAYANTIDALTYLSKLPELDLNLRNDEGWTPLFVSAALVRSLPATIELLASGALPDVPARRGGDVITALDMLLCTPDIATPDTRTIIHLLIEWTLRLQEAEPGLADLHMAALCNPLGLEEMLADAAKLDSEQRDELLNRAICGGYTALHMAASQAVDRSIKALLQAGANPTLRNKFQMTAVQLAVRGPASTLRYLMRRSCSFSKADVDPHTMLHDAVAKGSTELVQLICASPEGRALINNRDHNNDTPLMLATRTHIKAGLETMRELLRLGADPNLTNHYMQTALHGAASNSNKDAADMVKLLLSSGAHADPVSKRGTTPLLLACLHRNQEAALALLCYGADPGHEDGQGRTPFCVALDVPLVQLHQPMLDMQHELCRSAMGPDTALGLAVANRSSVLEQMLDLGATVCTMNTKHFDRKGKDKKYEMVFDRIGPDNFVVDSRQTLLGFVRIYGPITLFEHMLESDHIMEILDEANYVSEMQQIKSEPTPDSLETRGSYIPAGVTGLIDHILDNFEEGRSIELTYVLLSRGYQPDMLDAWLYFDHHRVSPMFHTLISQYLTPIEIPKTYLLPTVMMDFSKSVREHVRFFVDHVAPELNKGEMYVNIKSAGIYMASYELRVLFREALTKEGVAYEDFPSYIKRGVPSLQGLSRDVARDAIRKYFTVKTYQTYSALIKCFYAYTKRGQFTEKIAYRWPLYHDK